MITDKLREFNIAKYAGINWKNYPDDEYWTSIVCDISCGIDSFIEEFQEWEQAGFPDLDEYLTPKDGKVRTKKQ